MSGSFNSTQEFREVMDRVFGMMSDDPHIGPRLREADVPQRFYFDDVDLVLNVRSGGAGEAANLSWSWGEEVDWPAKVRITMSSETANRYFQGRINVAYAIARRRIKTSGELTAALELVPIMKPVYGPYRELLTREYPHLIV